MPGRVQRVPRSLVALAGLIGEQPPSLLLDEYRPTLDVSGLIIAELPLESDFAIDAAAVAGSNAAITVPIGENWFVEGMFGIVQNAAAAVNNVISINRNTVVEDVLYAIPGQTTPAIINSHTVFRSFTPPTVLLAGQQLSATLNATDAAGVQTLICFAQFRRIAV